MLAEWDKDGDSDFELHLCGTPANSHDVVLTDLKNSASFNMYTKKSTLCYRLQYKLLLLRIDIQAGSTFDPFVVQVVTATAIPILISY